MLGGASPVLATEIQLPRDHQIAPRFSHTHLRKECPAYVVSRNETGHGSSGSQGFIGNMTCGPKSLCNHPAPLRTLVSMQHPATTSAIVNRANGKASGLSPAGGAHNCRSAVPSASGAEVLESRAPARTHAMQQTLSRILMLRPALNPNRC